MNSYVPYKILDDKGISLTKAPFGVRSCEVALIGPNVCDVLQNMFSQVGLGKAPEMSGLVDTCPLLIHFIGIPLCTRLAPSPTSFVSLPISHYLHGIVQPRCSRISEASTVSSIFFTERTCTNRPTLNSCGPTLKFVQLFRGIYGTKGSQNITKETTPKCFLKFFVQNYKIPHEFQEDGTWPSKKDVFPFF